MILMFTYLFKYVSYHIIYLVNCITWLMIHCIVHILSTKNLLFNLTKKLIWSWGSVDIWTSRRLSSFSLLVYVVLWAEMTSISSWDGTITSTEFHNAASTLAEIWNNFDLGLPHCSWINCPNTTPFAATKVHLSAFLFYFTIFFSYSLYSFSPIFLGTRIFILGEYDSSHIYSGFSLVELL